MSHGGFWFLFKLVDIWSLCYNSFINNNVCEPDEIEIWSFIDLLLYTRSNESYFFTTKKFEIRARFFTNELTIPRIILDGLDHAYM